jgi:hypothetical protein
MHFDASTKILEPKIANGACEGYNARGRAAVASSF